MNKHILLVMKWLHNKDSVTQEELKANAESADVDTAAIDALSTWLAYDAAAGAGYCAWAAADAYAHYAYDDAYAYADAERNVTRYFRATGEDEQTYIDELEQSQ